MQSVVNLVLDLDRFVKTEVVMSLFQGVEVDFFVVLDERRAGPADRRFLVRIQVGGGASASKMREATSSYSCTSTDS